MNPVRHSRVLLAAIAAVLFALAGTGQASGATLATRLSRALTVPGVSWSATGAIAMDLRTGGRLYGRNAGLSLRPASNEKLAVALAALQKLGQYGRIPTRVLGDGSRDGTVWRGALVLKGYGDPTLSGGDLATLAGRIRNSGVRSLTGPVVGDESFFDSRRTAPGWKASFYKEECPPLSALIFDEGKVNGRTVDNPALAAARAFRRALVAAGVRVPAGARVGVAPTGATRLTRVLSPGTSTLVLQMNRQSDNFVAEMLLKRLGARELGRGTTAAGASVARTVLMERGVPLTGVRIVDGSGLSRYDRLTPRAAAALLISAWSDATVRRPFYRSLPLAGINGTLEDRLTTLPARGHVRAKTGTTDNASTLSGYVGTRYVFSVLMNGSPIPWWYARQGQDRFVQILADRVF